MSNVKCQMSNVGKKGFTAIELIISIFILIISIVGTHSFFSYIQAQTSNFSYKLTAAYLSQEGIEIIRNIRDGNFISLNNDWSEGLLDCQQGCQADYTTGAPEEETPLAPFLGGGVFLKINPNGLYSYKTDPNNLETKFKRKITITPQNEDILKISVIVFWENNGQQFNFMAEEYLYNWY